MNLLASKPKDVFEEFDLSEKAVDQAVNEYPKTTDTELDIHQQNVVDHMAASIVDIRNETLAHLNELDSYRTNIENDIDGFSLNQFIDIAKIKINRAKAEWNEILEKAKQEEHAALRNYKYFLYKNKLKREASYPDSKVLHWAFIILAVLFESIVNSFFFAGASDIGLLGGFFQALFISISNVGSALLIGIYVLPYKNHVDTKKVSRAKLATTLYLIFIFLFNLGASHYRTLLEEDPLSAKLNTIPHMINDPLGINFEAWNLLIIGMLFVFVAIIKGYKSDDIYPGFGEVDRTFKSSINHHGKRIQAMKTINQIIDDCAAQAKSYVQASRNKIKSYRDSIFQSEETVSDFTKKITSAENKCNNLLWEYRNANVRIRSTKPPEYFSQKYTFSKFSLKLDLSKENVTLNKIESRFSELANTSEQTLANSLGKFNEDALKDITKLFEKIK